MKDIYGSAGIIVRQDMEKKIFSLLARNIIVVVIWNY